MVVAKEALSHAFPRTTRTAHLRTATNTGPFAFLGISAEEDAGSLEETCFL
jgi:hypothetical protein